MDNNNNSYANLYGDENPKGDVVPPGVLPPEAEEVIYLPLLRWWHFSQC